MNATARILALTGPTAVGKTRLSLALAHRLGAEIVSCDSRQVYQQLDIGTAKPTQDERRQVPHHFVDELPLDADFSAGQFAREAEARMQEILARGRVPLVVGGSTLYLHALTHGLSPLPPTNHDVRDRLEARLEQEGAERLFAELQARDAESAATMDATKTQRLVRALEVLEVTGRRLSDWQREEPEPAFRYRVVVLHRPRQEVYDRIERRVDAMLEAGLLDEVERVMEHADANPLQTIGYREPLAHLRGEMPYEEMVRLVKRNTRHYAKRQLTWLRREATHAWIRAEMEADALLSLVGRGLMRT